MKILVFDNYDSFTYNLVHLVEKIMDAPVDVRRNDAITLDEAGAYDKIILSPGPGIPSEAGLLLPLLRRYMAEKSMLGVCLGHQAIAEACGASLYNMPEVFHGVATPLNTETDPGYLFQNLPQNFLVGRYHSWCVSDESLPADLRVTARDESGHIMAFEHLHYDVAGVQFHPESILTQHGEQIIRNFLFHPPRS